MPTETINSPLGIVATYFFVWFRCPELSMCDPAKMVFHPPGIKAPAGSPDSYSNRNPNWFAREVADMRAAAIDYAFVVHPVNFSCDYLPLLVQAAQGSGLKLGLFYDTNPDFLKPGQGDLSNGAQWATFADEIIAFYRAIPRELWATLQDRPVVLTFISHGFMHLEKANAFWDSIKTRFASALGVAPYLLLDVTWGTQPVADGATRYGPDTAAGPLHTRISGGRIAHISPGRDNRLVGGVSFKPRNGTKTFEDELRRVATDAPSMMTLIESWNELYEGSMIARAVDYGVSATAYIDLVRKYKQTPVEKFLRHYVLMPKSRALLIAALDYLNTFGCAFGSDLNTARRATQVTILGGEQFVSASDAAALASAGCQVERLGGDITAVQVALNDRAARRVEFV